MKNILIESLDYHDMEGQLENTVSVDEYSAKMGEDSEIVTLAFTVFSEAAGNDLVDWFERGYDFVLDAQVSEGEVSPGEYLVFVEMDRRTKVPERICRLLEDLETLTDKPLSDWKVMIDDEEYPAEIDVLKQHIILSPQSYREKHESDEDTEENISEMRELSGLEIKPKYPEQDTEIKNFKAIAGL
jgi:hypothetical protein